jgi:L-rhamnose mutarotase
MFGKTRRIVRIMDLNNQTDLLDAYDEAHRPGNTPVAVIDAQRHHGIAEMEIYRAGDRLIMIMEVTDSYNPGALDIYSARSVEITRWHQRMAQLQKAPLPDGMAWPEARRVFRQSEHG